MRRNNGDGVRRGKREEGESSKVAQLYHVCFDFFQLQIQ